MEQGLLLKRFSDVRLLILDADGVLTSGALYYGPNGSEYKVFDVKDGLGIKLLQLAGVEVAIISIKRSPALEARARDLGISHLIMGREDKAQAARELKGKLGVKREEVCAVGDDLPDLGLFVEAGVKVAVANAVQELKDAADWVVPKDGGRGAVREIAELILKAKGAWERLVGAYQINLYTDRPVLV